MVEKKMGHTPKVAGRHYEGNAAAGIAANAVVAIRKAGGKNTLKQKKHPDCFAKKQKHKLLPCLLVVSIRLGGFIFFKTYFLDLPILLLKTSEKLVKYSQIFFKTFFLDLPILF